MEEKKLNVTNDNGNDEGKYDNDNCTEENNFKFVNFLFFEDRLHV